MNTTVGSSNVKKFALLSNHRLRFGYAGFALILVGIIASFPKPTIWSLALAAVGWLVFVPFLVRLDALPEVFGNAVSRQRFFLEFFFILLLLLLLIFVGGWHHSKMAALISVLICIALAAVRAARGAQMKLVRQKLWQESDNSKLHV